MTHLSSFDHKEQHDGEAAAARQHPEDDRQHPPPPACHSPIIFIIL